MAGSMFGPRRLASLAFIQAAWLSAPVVSQQSTLEGESKIVADGVYADPKMLSASLQEDQNRGRLLTALAPAPMFAVPTPAPPPTTKTETSTVTATVTSTSATSTTKTETSTVTATVPPTTDTTTTKTETSTVTATGTTTTDTTTTRTATTTTVTTSSTVTETITSTETTTTATTTTRTETSTETSTSTQTTSTVTTSTVTTSTKTETTSTQTTSTQTTSTKTTTNLGCDALCEIEAFNATCRSRIAWTEMHTTKDESAPCPAAHVMVMSTCPSCGTCQFEDVKCISKRGVSKMDMASDFMYKFENDEARLSRWAEYASGFAVGGGVVFVMMLVMMWVRNSGRSEVESRTARLDNDQERLLDNAATLA